MVDKLNNSCMVCEYAITDPMCWRCYIKQVKAKLNDLDVNSFVIEVIVREMKNKFFIETLNSEVCILCEKENLTLCRYCFSLSLVNILAEPNFSEEFIKNFGGSPLDEEVDSVFM